MPRGVWKRTKEQNQKMSESCKKKPPVTDEARKNISKIRKGKIKHKTEPKYCLYCGTKFERELGYPYKYWEKRTCCTTKCKNKYYVGKNHWNYNKKASLETRKKQSDAKFGKTTWIKGLTKETDSRIKTPSTCFKKGNTVRLGSITSEETKQIQREKRIKYIEEHKGIKGGLSPCVGRYEKEILDVLEKTIGYTIFRQYRVAGYFLDGYCPNYNLAIEIDEERHQQLSKKEKDIIRQQNIEKELNCKFIRINI